MDYLIKSARELVENLFSGQRKKLGKEHFFMFTVSRFILLKENILKKDSANSILYFDNVKNADYIPALLAIASEVKKNGEFQLNSTKIVLKDSSKSSEQLLEALWLFNKIRDSLAHGQYTPDLSNDRLLINNDHSSGTNGYKLICQIPINLLNSISYYVEQIESKSNSNESESYVKYVDRILEDYNIDNIKLYDEKYVKDIYVYKDNYLKKYKINDNNLKEDNIKEDKKLKDSYDNLIDNLEYKNFELNEKSKNIELDKLLKNLTINELYRLIQLLLENESIKKYKNQEIQKILSEFKMLLNQKMMSQQLTSFNEKANLLIDEISALLGMKRGTKKVDEIAALYNYMGLVFSNEKEIDYSHLCLRDYAVLWTNDGSGKEYEETVAHINKFCVEFSEKMNLKIRDYHNNPNQSFRHLLMSYFIEFYESIMKSMGNKNKLVIRSIRNSIEHGNFRVFDDGNILLFDQADHNDLNSIKFLCHSSPQKLFDLAKKCELDDEKDDYIMDDFFQELKSILNEEVFTNVKYTMNKFSKIIFGKDINEDSSIEHMYHEAIATTISQVLSKK